MTIRTLTAAEAKIRAAVLDLNAGRCQLGCGRPATNYAHRLPQGQGGPYTAANGLGLCGSGTTGDHWRTEQARTLSYQCGWLLRTGTDPAATPALIVTVLGAGWHILGEPDGNDHIARLAYDAEVPDWMWPDGYDAAIDRLNQLTGGTAA